ncbi:ovarian cancer G-protein coupled receptor 1-like [Menidia menidia]
MDYTLQNQTNICSSYSSVEQDMYPTAYSLFFVVSFPANCLSLYVALMLMKKGNNVAVYLFSLSISDLLYTISLPVWIELALQKPVGDVLYSTVNLIMYNSFYVGSGLLCCISVDRYLAVVYPLHFHWVREVKTAAVVSTAVWILEIITHVILLDHMGALQTTKYLFEQRLPMTQEDANVALIRIVLGFLLPTLIMAFCFQQIMGSLQKSTSIVSKERRKVGLLLFFLLLTYIVSFLPYQTVMLLRATLEPGSCTWTGILRNSYLVTVAITTLNCTLDPIIYCLISESAKNEIKIVMKKSGELFRRTKCPKVSTGIHSVS